MRTLMLVLLMSSLSFAADPSGGREALLPDDDVCVPPARHLWGDVDGDGLKDLFVLSMGGNLLFRNDGNGRFADVTALAFDKGAGIGGNGFFGDYNADGRPDLFLFQTEGIVLMQNDGGFVYTDVTRKVGLNFTVPSGIYRLDDFDGDGFADLLVQSRAGDRIFRNHKGCIFSEVTLSLPVVSETELSSSSSPGPVPPTPVSGGAAAGNSNSIGTFTADAKFVNDNSPGSVGEGVPEVEGGDDISTLNDIVDGTVAAADLTVPLKIKGDDVGGPIFKGTNNAKTGTGKGIMGQSKSPDGFGVYGMATATSGYNYGVWGYSASPNGTGMYGYAPSQTGPAFGVLGRSDSDEGRGVYGVAQSSTGTTFGVWGQTLSPDGYGVRGYHSESKQGFLGGPDFGVYSTGDLVCADGAFRGNINGQGAPFPRPAWDSGWVDIDPHETKTRYHYLGGFEDDFFVDMTFFDGSTHHKKYLGGYVSSAGKHLGCRLNSLTNSKIEVYRLDDDFVCLAFRVRIWVIK